MGDPAWVIYHGHAGRAAADIAVGSGDTVGDIITEWNDKTVHERVSNRYFATPISKC